MMSNLNYTKNYTRFFKENMAYNEEEDVYTCHTGRTLKVQYIKETKKQKRLRIPDDHI